jgi:hypothetical protein
MSDRLFSVFEEPDEANLLQRCLEDLAAIGCDSFQCQRKAARILEEAKAIVSAEGESAGVSPTAVVSADSDLSSDLGLATRDGVAEEDARWYRNLPPLAKAVMQRFDDEVRNHLEHVLSPRNISLEDLELDLSQTLPAFGNASAGGGDDGLLPRELRRRVETFLDRLGRNQHEWADWCARTRRASSMNALIRAEIRAGHL